MRINIYRFNWTDEYTFEVFPCLIQLRVTIMMILCIHLMDSHDFDIMEWCYDEKLIIWGEIEGNFMRLDGILMV